MKDEQNTSITIKFSYKVNSNIKHCIKHYHCNDREQLPYMYIVVLVE